MNPEPRWTLVITVHADSPAHADWLRQALGPELSREVPRASATLSAPDERSARIEVHAKDTGAARAAANTYLSWVHLAWETMRRAQGEAAVAPGP